MIFSKDYIENIKYWEHRVETPPKLSSTTPPKIYDVFTIYLKSGIVSRKKHTCARKVTKVNNVWEHIPAPWAIQAHKELQQVGELPTIELSGPTNIPTDPNPQ